MGEAPKEDNAAGDLGPLRREIRALRYTVILAAGLIGLSVSVCLADREGATVSVIGSLAVCVTALVLLGTLGGRG